MSFGAQTYSDQEFNCIQAALRARLGPDFVATRPGPGGQKLYYVEAWRVVQLANQTFGFDGWSYNVTNMTVDFVDHSAGKFYVGISATVKVTLKNGAYREDVGYGAVEGMRSKSQAIEKARKESITDGLKRAMKSFGNLLGNCLSDKDYVKHLSRLGTKRPGNYSAPGAIVGDISSLPNFTKHSSKQASSEPPPRTSTIPHPRTEQVPQKNNMSVLAPPAKPSSHAGPSTSSTSLISKENVAPPPNKVTNRQTEELKSTQDAFDEDDIISQLENSADSKFWDEMVSKVDESSRLGASKFDKTRTPRKLPDKTPVRSSPRLAPPDSKRRRVTIPGITITD